jgi:CelD/BcsL family acetyltransferase involved in cellulose biosynthesis
MQIEIIRSITELAHLESEWNDLLKSSASHVPFLRYEYLTTWWQTLGGGEWEHGDLYIICGRDENGSLRGIAPFFLTDNLEGESALMLVGSIEISDYLDFIVPPEDLAQFTSLVFEHLASVTAPTWSVLDLYNLLEQSPTLGALKEASQVCGWQYSQERLQHSPYIPLPGNWETYLANIDKKQRHEIRRKIRRMEEAEVKSRWYIVQDGSGLDQEIDDFLRLMGQEPAKQAFLTDVMRTQMRAAVQAAFQAGWLQLAFLEIEGEKAAGYLNFDYDNHIWLYNSGWDPRFNNYSPGWVLLGYLLQWANEHGRASFDFMRGDEEYKYRFGGIDRYVTRVRIERA